MGYHKYKNKPGGYYRGRSRRGRYYTSQGCLIPIINVMLIIFLIILIIF